MRVRRRCCPSPTMRRSPATIRRYDATSCDGSSMSMGWAVDCCAACRRPTARWPEWPSCSDIYARRTTAGGDNFLVDGWRVAEEVRAAQPAGFKLLAERAVTFRYSDATAELS